MNYDNKQLLSVVLISSEAWPSENHVEHEVPLAGDPPDPSFPSATLRYEELMALSAMIYKTSEKHFRPPLYPAMINNCSPMNKINRL